MKLRKVEESMDFSIESLFDVLVEVLKDYISASPSYLNKIKSDWLDTVDYALDENPNEQSDLDIPIKLPIKPESNFDIFICKGIGCEVKKDWEVSGTLHLYKVYEDNSYDILMNFPSLSTLMEYYCGKDVVFEDDLPFEERIMNLDQAREFANKIKKFLDSYKTDLTTIYNSLEEMDNSSRKIWNVFYKRGEL